MPSLIRKVDVEIAHQWLEEVKGIPDDRLTAIEFMAKIAACLAVMERRKQVVQASSWSRANVRRKELTGRIDMLRNAIKRLEGKPASKFVPWPARRELHIAELARHESELSKLLGKMSDKFST